MYAIVEIGGQQHRVAEGDRLRVLGLPKSTRGERKEGSRITISKVLAVGQGKRLKIGAPYVPNAKVIASVERELRGPRVTVFKFERRKKERTKRGHRQRYIEIWVKSIEPGDAARDAKPQKTAEQSEPRADKKGR